MNARRGNAGRSRFAIGCGCATLLVLVIAAASLIGALSGAGAGSSTAMTAPTASAPTTRPPTEYPQTSDEADPAPDTDPESGSEPDEPTPPLTGDPAIFLSVVDGDTIETNLGTVRIIGIDTPERGECGYRKAAKEIRSILSKGDPIGLELPPGQNDRDRYDRLLRYVITENGIDVGFRQLEAGHAVARYDSRDGYPGHPHERAYRKAQRAALDRDGAVVTAACGKSAGRPSAEPKDSSGGEWWLAYSSCTKLKRNDVGDPTGPFSRDDPAQAEIYEWFAHGTGNRGDGDGDGLACE